MADEVVGGEASGTVATPPVVEKPQEGLPKVAPERKLAPIPDKGKGKTTLPGVFKHNDDEGDDAIPLLRRERGPDGKFLSQKDRDDAAEEELFEEAHGGEPREVDPEETSAPGEAVKDKPAPALPGEKPAVATGKVSLGGKEYESLEKADQAHRTLQGMFKPLTEVLGPNPGDWGGKVQELKEAGKLKQERDYGYEAAFAWEKVAKEIAENAGDVAKVQELVGKYKLGVVPRGVGNGKPGTSPQGGTGGVNPELSAVMDQVDLDVFENLTINGGLKAGGKYLVEQILSVVQNQMIGKVSADVAARFAPQEAQQQEAALRQSTEAVLDQLIALKTTDGQEAFPELKDPATLHEIGSIWRNQNLPPEYAITREGLMSAVALYRMLKGFESPRLPVVTNQQTQDGRDDRPAPAAAASVDGDDARNPLGGRRSNLSPEAQRFVNSLKDTTWINPVLGFTPRRKEARG